MKKAIIAGLALTLTLSLASAVMAEDNQPAFPSELDTDECIFEESTPVGEHVEFTTTDLDGNEVDSESLFGNADITMVNIWRTSCDFCIGEFPQMNELAANIADKDFRIVTYCCDAHDDESREKAHGIVSDFGNMTHLADDFSFDSSLQFEGTPTSYFVNREGYVVSPGLMGALVNYYEQLFDYYQAQSRTLSENGEFAEQETESDDEPMQPGPGTEVAQPGDRLVNDDGTVQVVTEDGELVDAEEYDAAMEESDASEEATADESADGEAEENAASEETTEAENTDGDDSLGYTELYPQPDFLSELKEKGAVYEGSPAVGTHIDFTVNGLNGSEMDSDTMFSLEDITMVTVWTTENEKCVNELSHLEEIAEEYSEKGGQIVTFCADAIDEESCAHAEELLGTNNLLGRFDTGESFRKALPFEGTPTTYFVNRAGNLVSPGFKGMLGDDYGRLFDFYLEHSANTKTALH